MDAGASKNDKVCAVVVTYNPPPSFSENLRLLALETTEIIVVDNGSGGDLIQALETVTKHAGVNVIRNNTNLGIAAALNIGIRQALRLGYKWVATFDQDSTITADYFKAMLDAHLACAFREQVPLIAPTLCISEAECEQLGKKQSSSLFSLTRTAMTSGSLFRTDIFQVEGFYDEGLFMDYVDYDFCLRLWKHGWKIIRAKHAFLIHRLGAAETHRFLGFRITIKSHTPWRRYHIMRNRVFIYRRYALSSPFWCLYDFIWIFLELTKILVFEKEKTAKMRNVLRGIADGLAGKTGALTENVSESKAVSH